MLARPEEVHNGRPTFKPSLPSFAHQTNVCPDMSAWPPSSSIPHLRVLERKVRFGCGIKRTRCRDCAGGVMMWAHKPWQNVHVGWRLSSKGRGCWGEMLYNSVLTGSIPRTKLPCWRVCWTSGWEWRWEAGLHASTLCSSSSQCCPCWSARSGGEYVSSDLTYVQGVAELLWVWGHDNISVSQPKMCTQCALYLHYICHGIELTTRIGCAM